MPLVELRAAPAPSVRIVRVPRSEPPGDDEVTPPSGPARPGTVPSPSTAAVPTQSRPDPATGGPAATADGDCLAPPAAVRRAARLVIVTFLEVVSGFRPMAHLRPLCRPDRFADITNGLATPARQGLARRPGNGARGPSRIPPPARSTGAPPRAGRMNSTGPSDRVILKRMHLCAAAAGVVEVAAVLAHHDRVWAMALRLEHARGRWLCTHLEVV